MIATWARHGTGLQAQAYAADVEPTTLQRALRRIGSLGWIEVRGAGVDAWLARMTTEVDISCGSREG